MTTKPATKITWNKTLILDKIAESPFFTERALLALYKRQTEDEKVAKETKYHNKMGFTGGDAKYLSYCARWLLASPKNHLNADHLTKVRLRLQKYATQLAKVANENMKAKAVPPQAEAALAGRGDPPAL